MNKHDNRDKSVLRLATRSSLAFGLGLGAFLLLLGFVRASQAPAARPNLLITYVGSSGYQQQQLIVGRPNTISVVIWNEGAVSAKTSLCACIRATRSWAEHRWAIHC